MTRLKIVPCCNSVTEAHEKQESDPVEEEGGEECREEDEVVAQQGPVGGLQVQGVVERWKCEKSKS